MNASIARRLSLATIFCGLALLAGCSDRPSLFENPDPALRKTRTEFKADAIRRTYPEDAPRVQEPKARAQVAYMFKRVDVVNFTDEDWSNVELWVNRRYVCHLPSLPRRELKRIDFAMLYDQSGRKLEINKTQPIVNSVEVYRDGVLYAIVAHNADW